MTKIQMPEPVAWMLACQTYAGDTAWNLSWTQSGAGACHRLSGEEYEKPLITTDQAEAYADARGRESQQWQPIETAPKSGRSILLGFVNSHGNWRTMLGRWISKEEILNEWEDGDLFDEGWYEISVEADDVPNCWLTNPSHWMPLPLPPTK